MTDAPEALLAPRRLLLEHLEPYGLEPLEVGIKGDAAHVGEGDSYHLGSPEQDPRGSYSIMESTRDRYSLTGYASALDVGTFAVGSHNLRTFSAWSVTQCVAGAPDTKDIREIIYSPDGRTVKRWDRLGKRTTGDSSHTFHTHFSFFRDAIKAGRDQSPLFRRYLATIGLIDTEEPDMTPEEGRKAAFLGTYDALYQMASGSTREGGFMRGQFGEIVEPLLAPIRADVAALRSQLQAVSSADATRDAELRTLLERVQSGAIDPAAFVDEVARRLSGSTSA